MSGDDGAVNLGPLLEAAVKLEDFKFGYSRVATRGGVALAAALGKTSSLLRLDLTGNTMGPDTARPGPGSDAAPAVCRRCLIPESSPPLCPPFSS